MIFTNSWKSKKKQSDRIIAKIRWGRCTILDFYWNRPKKQIGFTLFNYGVKNGTPLNKERP